MSASAQLKDSLPDMPYHTLPEAELCSVLGSGAQGLTSEQADAHRVRFGYNDISQIRKRPVLLQFLEHFKNLLVILLLFAAAISIFVGEITDAAIIIVIIVASVTLDFFQEYRAENAAELLRQKIVTRAAVYRDGRQQELPIIELVPGDLIFLSAGDIVPADAG
jgi:Mg2+-importing ATPase